MRGLCQFLVGSLLLATLAGCGLSPTEERDAWRGDAERRCLSAGFVRPSATKVAMREIEGPGRCGMEHPFKVSALTERDVAVKPAAVLACPAIAHFEAWVHNDIQPAAMQYFGQPVIEVQIMASYSCRTMNGQRGAKISEHAFGNGIDVGGFKLADGRVVKVVSGWSGAQDERGFLRTVYGEACDTFTTVLAPGSNSFHYNHIHVDLARHDVRGRRHYCRPKLGPPPPAMSPLISQLGAPVPQQTDYPEPPMPRQSTSYPEPPMPEQPSLAPEEGLPLEPQISTSPYPPSARPDLDLQAAQPTARDTWPEERGPGDE